MAVGLSAGAAQAASRRKAPAREIGTVRIDPRGLEGNPPRRRRESNCEVGIIGGQGPRVLSRTRGGYDSLHRNRTLRSVESVSRQSAESFTSSRYMTHNSTLKKLFLISAGGLFLELVLIRLLASEIRVFAYFKNFPLLAAFIGLGLGCYVADKRPIRLWLSASLVAFLSLCAAFSGPLHLANLFFPDPALYVFRGSILSPNIIEQAQSYPLIGSLYGKVSNGTLLFTIGVTSFAIMAALFTATAMVFFPIGQLT